MNFRLLLALSSTLAIPASFAMENNNNNNNAFNKAAQEDLAQQDIIEAPSNVNAIEWMTACLIEERRERAEEAVRAVQQRAQQNISGENKRTTPKRLDFFASQSLNDDLMFNTNANQEISNNNNQHNPRPQFPASLNANNNQQRNNAPRQIFISSMSPSFNQANTNNNDDNDENDENNN